MLSLCYMPVIQLQYAKTLGAAWLLVSLTACGSDAPPGGSPYSFDVPTGHGIGKTFHGREIARVEGHADHLDRPTRALSELPERVLDVMALRPDETIADVGAGTGFFTFRLAKRVPQGQVLAIDIDSDMLQLVSRRADSLGLSNVRTIKGTEQSPQLPPRSADAVLVVDSYHEFSYPAEMLAGLRDGLREGGRLFLVEYRGEDDTLPVDRLHRMTEAQVRTEVEAAGFVFVVNHAVLPQQHLFVFERAAER